MDIGRWVLKVIGLLFLYNDKSCANLSFKMIDHVFLGYFYLCIVKLYNSPFPVR